LRKRRSPEKDACSFQEEWHADQGSGDASW